MRLNKGFTIWELVVVMAIVVILSRLAIPAFSSYTQQRRSEVIAAQLQDVIQYSRAEALRRGIIITICGANYTSNKTLYGCQSGVNVNNWSDGALSYIDSDSSSSYNTGERVKAARFETETLSPATVSAPSAILRINPDSTLSDASGNESWVFTITQSINGASLVSKVKLNKFGNSSFCKVGVAGC
ncbi:MAG: Type secretion system protein [Pseudomonadota bacterium]|nr:GspH/FimT family pseudopilin [Burkholderiales bacterium]MBP9767996.1 GspH/FimT family pseudopilin [Burkholderiales bacterium]MDQ5948510.1 Type secretion system protein [Pseudomonadota bacterium]HCY39510.1 hypothetical protein [Neisseriales bacterium]